MKKIFKIVIATSFSIIALVLALNINWFGNTNCNQKNQLQKNIYQKSIPNQELPIENALQHLVVTI